MIPYLRRGALAGVVGGVVGALVLLALGEQSISDAIALEEAGGGGAPVAIFSRREQLVGGAAGTVLVGVALGAIFAVAFVALRPRLPGPTDWHRAIRLGLVAFVVITLVPFLKYPGNPPAVGDPDTIGRRTLLYLLMLVWSIVAALAAVRFRSWLSPRSADAPWAGPAAVAVWVGLVGLGYVLLPGNPDPVEAPAQLVWRFRVASLGGTLALWSITGAVFGWFCVRQAAASVDERTGAPV